MVMLWLGCFIAFLVLVFIPNNVIYELSHNSLDDEITVEDTDHTHTYTTKLTVVTWYLYRFAAVFGVIILYKSRVIMDKIRNVRSAGTCGRHFHNLVATCCCQCCTAMQLNEEIELIV